MMNDVRERERMGQAATTIVERFSWDAMLERYESTLWDVVVNNE